MMIEPQWPTDAAAQWWATLQELSAAASLNDPHEARRGPWPAQQMQCAICRGLYYRACGERLKCKNAFTRAKNPCWNHAMVPTAIVRQQIVPRVVNSLRANAGVTAWLETIGLGRDCVLFDQASETSSAVGAATQLEKRWVQQPALLESVLRLAIHQLTIQPIQTLDTAFVRPRGYLTVRCLNETGQLVDTASAVDLFELPAYIKHLPACLAYEQAHPQRSFPQIAAALKISHLTVKRVFAYLRLMEAQHWSEPYVELQAAPAKASRWRRHASQAHP